MGSILLMGEWLVLAMCGLCAEWSLLSVWLQVIQSTDSTTERPNCAAEKLVDTTIESEL